MQRPALCLLAGLLLVSAGVFGCERDPGPKYVMPDVPPVDPDTLVATPLGEGGPASSKAKQPESKVPRATEKSPEPGKPAPDGKKPEADK